MASVYRKQNWQEKKKMSFNRKTPPADGQLGQEGEEGEKRQPEERNRYTM